MYSYQLELSFYNPKAELDLQEDRILTILQEAVQSYNTTCSHAAQNPKMIELGKIYDKTFELELTSALPLTVPGKALRTLSKILLEHGEFESQVTSSGQLLKVTVLRPGTEKNTQDTLTAVSEIDDAELLKCLVDYVCKTKDTDSTTYRKKRAAISQMKQIALDAGIIKR